jgi:hypothetical protein
LTKFTKLPSTGSRLPVTHLWGEICGVCQISPRNAGGDAAMATGSVTTILRVGIIEPLVHTYELMRYKFSRGFARHKKTYRICVLVYRIEVLFVKVTVF